MKTWISLTPLRPKPSRAEVSGVIKATMKDYARTMKKLAQPHRAEGGQAGVGGTHAGCGGQRDEATLRLRKLLPKRA